MTLPRIPTAPEVFESARDHIVHQHGTLRRDLRRVMLTADAAARGDTEALQLLPSLIIMVLGELTTHMAYEESVLPPVLNRTGPAGVARVDAIKQEHERQRAEFKTMLTLATDHDDALGLVLALQTLISDVLADMVEEETMLVNELLLVQAAVPRTD